MDDFQHVDHQAIFALVQESVDQDVAEPLNFVLGSLSLPMMDKADDLLQRTSSSTRLKTGSSRMCCVPS